MLRVSLNAFAALLAIAMVCSRAEATDCTKTPDLLENCDQWTACVKSAGVGCYGSSGVNKLYLAGLKISGTIPIDFGQMTGLNISDLSRNQISGTIPDAIGNLTKLGNLGLNNNQISGTIPDAFGQLTKLEQLGLNNNTISGTIPDAFGQLTTLQYLRLYYTQITGAGAGICSIVENRPRRNTPCNLGPNPAWTNGTMCPACLNTGRCKPPVTCTGPNTPTSPPVPTPPTPTPPTPTPPTPSPTPSPTTLSPTPWPTTTNKPCECDYTPGSDCVYGDPEATRWPHVGQCSNGNGTEHVMRPPACDCSACPSRDEDLCPPEHNDAWAKFEAFLCFGVSDETAPHCGEIMLAWWLAVIAAVLYECVTVPLNALKIAYTERKPYHKALWHAFTHQCWCCAKRHAVDADDIVGIDVDSQLRSIPWHDWHTQRSVYDRVQRSAPMSSLNAVDLIAAPLLGPSPHQTAARGLPVEVQEARDALMLDPRRVKVGPSIGAGGNGEVHRGTFARKACVFKAVFTSNNDAFWREAKLLSELDHPNVVKLFGVVEMKARSKYGGHTKELLMVMEYVKRGSIADAAKSGAYVPRQHWQRHAVELATAVAWLHDQGVVHRDLKPSNVLLADDGSIKICDLGVSRRQSEGDAAATVQDMMTMTVGVGTFPFMPPEVMRDAARQHDKEDGGAAFGDRHRYDGRAVDVYSLAITLIQMWTCKQLYPGAGAVDLLRDVPEGRRPLLPSNVPSLLVDLLVRMHSGEPSERISAAKVRDVLASDVVKRALREVNFVVNGEDQGLVIL